jgi:hypothetical protein
MHGPRLTGWLGWATMVTNVGVWRRTAPTSHGRPLLPSSASVSDGSCGGWGWTPDRQTGSMKTPNLLVVGSSHLVGLCVARGACSDIHS